MIKYPEAAEIPSPSLIDSETRERLLISSKLTLFTCKWILILPPIHLLFKINACFLHAKHLVHCIHQQVDSGTQTRITEERDRHILKTWRGWPWPHCCFTLSATVVHDPGHRGAFHCFLAVFSVSLVCVTHYESTASLLIVDLKLKKQQVGYKHWLLSGAKSFLKNVNS